MYIGTAPLRMPAHIYIYERFLQEIGRAGLLLFFRRMTIQDAYWKLYRNCLANGLDVEPGGHYGTRIDFGGQPSYVSPDGSDVVRYMFNITGCVKTRLIRKNGKVIKAIRYHNDRLPVYGTIVKRKNLRGFLYKFLLFLRCDGIENPDLMRLYLLHCLAFHFEFWRKRTVRPEADGKTVAGDSKWELYQPDYSCVEKMIDGLIKSS